MIKRMPSGGAAEILPWNFGFFYTGPAVSTHFDRNFN